MKELTRFKRWANRNRIRRGMICHFYISESKAFDEKTEQKKPKQKQYYGKVDYAYFNLFSDSQDWLIKGTTEHGVRSIRDELSQIPCLNCFEVNDKFCNALEALLETGNDRFGMGIILNKRRLKLADFKVIPVEALIRPPSPFPPLSKCHHFDWARLRRALWPFNDCDVVRVEIPKSKIYEIPIVALPYRAIMGLLVRQKGYREKAMNELLDAKKWNGVEIFLLL
jgi:hypothetical protein